MEILVIHNDNIPANFKAFFKANSCNLHFVRGPLSLESKLLCSNIEHIIWISSENLKILFSDIVEILNKYKLPVIFLGNSSLSESQLATLKVRYGFISDLSGFSQLAEKINLDENDEVNEYFFRYVLKSNSKQKKINIDSATIEREYEMKQLSKNEKSSLNVSLGAPLEKQSFIRRVFNL